MDWCISQSFSYLYKIQKRLYKTTSTLQRRHVQHLRGSVSYYVTEPLNSPKYSYLNVVHRGLIPYKTLFCGVWYPARLKFQGIWYPAGSCSATQNKILRGIRPCWQIKTPWNQMKKFWELAILFKGTLFEIIWMYKLHYPRCIGSKLKEPPIWKMFFCSAGSDTPQSNF